MSDASIPWPPLIVADQIPRWVKWRDFLLTLMMWILFAVVLEREFKLFVGRLLEYWGLGDFETEANWVEFFEKLMPHIQVTLMLVGVLALASLITLYRRRRGLLLPAPPLLEIANEARRAGMEEDALAAARDLRIAVVHIDENGTHRVTPR